MPTFQCHKYGYNFTNLTDYGIIQNTADKFQGDRIAIMYDPGYYPAIIDGKFRNGGVPQEGNLSKHLVLFKKDLEKAVPDPNFKGKLTKKKQKKTHFIQKRKKIFLFVFI